MVNRRVNTYGPHLDGEEHGQDGLQNARHDAGVVEVLREELA